MFSVFQSKHFRWMKKKKANKNHWTIESNGIRSKMRIGNIQYNVTQYHNWTQESKHNMDENKYNNHNRNKGGPFLSWSKFHFEHQHSNDVGQYFCSNFHWTSTSEQFVCRFQLIFIDIPIWRHREYFTRCFYFSTGYKVLVWYQKRFQNFAYQI